MQSQTSPKDLKCPLQPFSIAATPYVYKAGPLCSWLLYKGPVFRFRPGEGHDLLFREGSMPLAATLLRRGSREPDPRNADAPRRHHLPAFTRPTKRSSPTRHSTADGSALLTSPSFDAPFHGPVDLGVRENPDLGNEYDPCPRYPGRQRPARCQRRAPAGELKHHQPPGLLHRLEQTLGPSQLRRQPTDRLLQPGLDAGTCDLYGRLARSFGFDPLARFVQSGGRGDEYENHCPGSAQIRGH